MELVEFVKTSHLDYEEKRSVLLQLDRIKKDNKFFDFLIQYFPRMIEEHDNMICEKQRENCAKVFDTYVTVLGKNIESSGQWYYSILNADQPKIEDVL